MKVIGITGQKGGTGKTTLTVNLAAWFAERGFTTTVLDRDPQGGVTSWKDTTDDEWPFTVLSDLRAPLGSIVASRRRLRNPQQDIMLIDTAPSIGGAFREVPHVADIILIPTRPTPRDIKSLRTAYTILTTEFERKRVYVVFTQVFSRFMLTGESRDALDALGIPYLQAEIGHRTLYQLSEIEGQSVFISPQSQAATEVAAVGKEVARLLDISLTRKKKS